MIGVGHHDDHQQIESQSPRPDWPRAQARGREAEPGMCMSVFSNYAESTTIV